jgi:hypothetical protein
MQDELVIIPSFFAACSWILWVLVGSIRRYKTAKLQAGVHTALIEKFGSSQELLAYVQSDAGKRLVGSLGVERSSPYGRIFFALQTGAVLVPLALGFLFLRGRVAGAEEGFLVFGTLILTLGIGFTLAAAVSYMMSKSFGLLDNSPVEGQ